METNLKKKKKTEPKIQNFYASKNQKIDGMSHVEKKQANVILFLLTIRIFQ